MLLDAGPLGSGNESPTIAAKKSIACTQWLQGLILGGAQVFVPEIADYEVRRELLRANKTSGLARLDGLGQLLNYLPLTTTAFRQAALFWAQARQQGYPTADDKALDGDVILCAQAITLGVTDVVIASTNVAHLSHFAPADVWQNIHT